MRRRILVQILVQCVHDGSTVRSYVNTQLWSEITRVMNVRTNRVWTAGQISLKYERLQQDYIEFSNLLNHETEFGWDLIRNTVSGTATQ
jgi:hypothetical protein